MALGDPRYPCGDWEFLDILLWRRDVELEECVTVGVGVATVSATNRLKSSIDLGLPPLPVTLLLNAKGATPCCYHSTREELILQRGIAHSYLSTRQSWKSLFVQWYIGNGSGASVPSRSRIVIMPGVSQRVGLLWDMILWLRPKEFRLRPEEFLGMNIR